MDCAGDSAGHSAVGTSGIIWTMRLWETLVRVTFGTFMGGLEFNQVFWNGAETIKTSDDKDSNDGPFASLGLRERRRLPQKRSKRRTDFQAILFGT